MVRLLGALLLALTLALSAPGGAQASTSAASVVDGAKVRGCVTFAEFRAVRRGWTRARVERRFKATGRAARRGGIQYKMCRQRYLNTTYAFVQYQRRNGVWRVVAKEWATT